MVDSIYGVIKYGDGNYGQQPKLKISANPFYALAMDYSTIRVFWENPVATADSQFIGIRLIRNFDQFPEHPEDGEILIESRGTNPTLLNGVKQFDDTKVIPGQFVYYRIWLLMSLDYSGTAGGELTWLVAGETYVLIPKPHHAVTPANTYKPVNVSGYVVSERVKEQELRTTNDKFMSLIPEIFKENRYPNGTRGENTDLSSFLAPFSFMLDSILTYADITKPDLSGRTTNPTVLNLESFQTGLPYEPNGVTRAQKKLIRDAIWTYSRKGTLLGLQKFVENITGYSSSITVLPNLLLSMQDASFYKGIGNWTSSSYATLTAEQNVVPTAGSSDVVYDTEWVGKVVTTATNQTINSGSDSPVTKGIPVEPLTDYTLYFWVKSAASSTVTPSVVWYDIQGNVIPATYSALSSVSTSTSFGSATTRTVTSPATAVKAVIKFTLASIDTYRFDRVSLVQGTTVTYYTEPRTVSIFLNPDKTNYILNPSFEDNTSNWSATNATLTQLTGSSSDVLPVTGISARNDMVKVQFTSSPATVSATACTPPVGSYYTFSIYHATKTGTQAFTLNLKATCETTIVNSRVAAGVGTVWFLEDHMFQIGDQITFSGTTSLNAVSTTVTAAGSNYVSFATSVSAYAQAVDTGKAILTLLVTKSVTATTTWGRSSVSLNIPANFPYDLTSRYTTVTAYITSTATGTVYLDAAQLEPRITASDYFDGSLYYQNGVWAGTANASISYQYTNHTQHIARLKTTVMDYLPKNTVYVIKDYYMIGNSSVTVQLA